MLVSINSFIAEERELLERFSKWWSKIQSELGAGEIPDFLELGEWSEQFNAFLCNEKVGIDEP